jgi:hypothetical protein
MNLAHGLDAAILARLKGELPASLDVDERVRGRARDGDAEAQALVAWAAAEAAWADRVARALARERVTVTLADGSGLSLDDAEKLLAKKEEERAHVALRDSIERAVSPFRHFSDHRSGGTDEKVDRAAWLSATRPARDAALELLGTLGHEEPRSPRALCRALDLPSASGAFSEAAALALLVPIREAAGPSLVRGVKRTRVPRALAGIALENLPEARFGTCTPTLRFQRHARSLLGAATAIAAALHDFPNESGHIRGAPARAAGTAVGLAALGAATRRAVLGESRTDADRHARIAGACAVLELRAAVALAAEAEAGSDGRGGDERVDRAREALIDAWGGDPGRGEVLERLDAAEPDAAWRAAAAILVCLRDDHDEGLAVRPDAWRALREDTNARASDEQARAAWVRLAEESLS